MMNVREDRAAILVIAVTATALACRPAPLDDLELLAHIEEVENAVAGQPRDVVQEILRDQATFERLAPGNEVSFSCRIAALIRGKSVYCVPEVLSVVEKCRGDR